MLELRRIRAGIFKEESIVNLYDFEKAVEEYENGDEKKLKKMIMPAEIVSEVYPAVKINGDKLDKIFAGKPIHKEDLIEKEKFETGIIISVFCEDRFIGMYEVKNEDEVFAKSKFVMQDISN